MGSALPLAVSRGLSERSLVSGLRTGGTGSLGLKGVFADAWLSIWVKLPHLCEPPFPTCEMVCMRAAYLTPWLGGVAGLSPKKFLLL